MSTGGDAYEYAKNISEQLSLELISHMNQNPGSLKDFDKRIGTKMMHFRNGTAEYKDHHSKSDDWIVNGTFDVQTKNDTTIIEFAPNFLKFSVTYKTTIDNAECSNETFGMEYKYVPIKITIGRQNDSGNIKATIDYGYEKNCEDSDEDEYGINEYLNGPDPWFGEPLKVILQKHLEDPLTAKQYFLTDIQQELLREFEPNNVFDGFKEQLCNLFKPGSKFLQPQLDQIVALLPFPREAITADRWIQIINKLTVERLTALYGNAYEYANGMSCCLQNALINDAQNRAWSDVIIPLPSHLFDEASLQLKFDYAGGTEFAFAFVPPYVKPGSFSKQTSGNVKIMKFAPNYRFYVIGHKYRYKGLKGNVSLRFNYIPINIEIEHQIDAGATKARVVYGELNDDDYNLDVEPGNEDYDSESDEDYSAGHVKPPVTVDREDQTLRNFLMNEFYATAEFRKKLCDIFEPGSQFLQSALDEMVKKVPFKFVKDFNECDFSVSWNSRWFLEGQLYDFRQ